MPRRIVDPLSAAELPPPNDEPGGRSAWRCQHASDCMPIHYDPITATCCTCNLISITRADEASFKVRCDPGPCAAKCDDSAKVVATCVDGACDLKR